MKLYKINEAIQELADRLVDPDTGEIAVNEDEIMEEIGALQMERKSILEYLAKIVLNNRADADAMKTEETRLKNCRKILEKREDRLMYVLKRECPETTRLGVVTLCYRKTRRVEVSDEAAAVAWLKENQLENCINQPEPTVYKDEVKKLISAGKTVPGCAIVEDRAASLR